MKQITKFAIILALAIVGLSRTTSLHSQVNQLSLTNDLACVSFNMIVPCPPNANMGVVGVFQPVGQTRSLITSGSATVNLATAALTTNGDYACTNPVAATVIDSPSPCVTGQQVGTIGATNFTAVPSVKVNLNTPAISGGTGQLVCLNGYQLSVCPANGVNVAGVFQAGGAIAVVNSGGYATANLAASVTTVLGDFVCTNSVPGTAIDNGLTQCPIGQMAGFIASNNTSPVPSVGIFLVSYGFPGPGGPIPNYSQWFTNVTTITMPGSVTGIDDPDVLVQCYDSGIPLANMIEPASVQVNQSTMDVIVNFAIPQTGYCAINSSGQRLGALNPSVITCLANYELGSDIGAKINNCIAALPPAGGVVGVAAAPGCYQFTTPIVAGKPVILQGAGTGTQNFGFNNTPGGTCLQYTATTGVAYTRSWGGGEPPGAGIRDIYFFGPGPTTATEGVLFGGGGDEGSYDANIKIENFGTGFDYGTGGSTFQHHCNDCWIGNNGVNANLSTIGENAHWFGGALFNTSPNHPGCVLLGGGDITFYSTSFDSCQVRPNAGNQTVVITGAHFENPNADDIPFIEMLGGLLTIRDMAGLGNCSSHPPSFLDVTFGGVGIKPHIIIDGGFWFSCGGTNDFININSGGATGVWERDIQELSNNYSYGQWLGGTAPDQLHMHPNPLPPYQDIDSTTSYPSVYAGNGNQQQLASMIEYSNYGEVTSAYGNALQLNPPFPNNIACSIIGKPVSAVTDYRVSSGTFGSCGAQGSSCIFIAGTPSTLSPPSGLIVTDVGTGGNLSPNTSYCYEITAVDLAFSGSPYPYGTSLPSSQVCATTANDGHTTHSMSLAWALTPEALGYNVYGRASGAEQLITALPLVDYVFTVNPSFIDTGATTPSGAVPTAATATGIRFWYNCIGK